MLTRIPITRRSLLLIGAGAAAVALLGAGGQGIQAASQLLPTPGPTPTPGPAPTASHPVVGGGRSPYLTTPPLIIGKTLHWVQLSYSYNPQSPDPTNGQVVLTEVWEQIGADGLSIRHHAVSTLPDGTFDQEILEDSSESTLILGKIHPSTPLGCALRHPSSASAGAPPPPFADEALLTAAGFRQSGGLTKKLPSTSSLPGVTPLVSYGPENTARGWDRTEARADGASHLIRVEIGIRARVLFSQARLTDKDGVIDSESWFAYGPLQVYDPASVPATVYTLSRQAQEECHA